MKRIAFAVGLVVLAFGVSILAQTQTESVEQELIRLEKAWSRCWIKPDFALFDRILADDFTWTEPTGEVITKADEIAALKSEENLVDFFKIDKIKVRVYGDAGVVNSLWRFKWTEEGKPKEIKDQCTTTWVKIAGRWQCVAGHASRIAPKLDMGGRT